MSLRASLYSALFSAKAADGYSLVLGVTDFRHVIADLATASMGVGSTLTLRFQGSIGQTAPTFSSPATVSNRWTYVELIDTNTGATIIGDVGVTIAGADDLKKVELNVNGLDFVCCQLSSYSGPGSLTVFARALNNG